MAAAPAEILKLDLVADEPAGFIPAQLRDRIASVVVSINELLAEYNTTMALTLAICAEYPDARRVIRSPRARALVVDTAPVPHPTGIVIRIIKGSLETLPYHNIHVDTRTETDNDTGATRVVYDVCAWSRFADEPQFPLPPPPSP
jgi:hypothetical protein